VLSGDGARRPALEATLASVRSHASTIRDFKPRVESITEQVTALPTASSVGAISSAYISDHNRALRTSEIYRLCLYLASVILLAYGADRTLNLVKSRLAVEQGKAGIEAKGQFLASMSHELRTPMNGILGFAQLLDRAHFGPLTAKQRVFVDGILGAGWHLLDLTKDILDLSKIETGRLTVSVEAVELVPLMKSVVATLEQSAAKSGISVVAGDFGRALRALMADRVRLVQCLLNIGSNAIKYNRPGGTVSVSYEDLGDGWARICVTDTGFGIPEDRQAELFQPFNRIGAERSEIEGTGIGLALTRRLVELMGGRIGFSSTLGQGSRFWIDIPSEVAASPGQRPMPAAVIPDRAPAATTPAQPARILVVDDVQLNQMIVENLLTAAGHAVTLADNGAEAVAAVQAHGYDLIFMDMEMPELDGVSATRVIRQLSGPERDIPIIALSANAMPDEIERCRAAGMNDHVTKPIDCAVLLAAVAKWAPAGGAAPAGLAAAANGRSGRQRATAD
jgi:signal transduction histidine kinase/CheY-like chemotaxis protein